MSNILRIVTAGPERDPYIPLLLIADDSPEQVRGYYQKGTLFALHDTETDEPLGVILTTPYAGGSTELKAVAVTRAKHGVGIGSAMLREVLERLRADGVRHVVVGTRQHKRRAPRLLPEGWLPSLAC